MLSVRRTTRESRSKGNRKPETSSGPRSRPAGIWFGCACAGPGVGQNSDPEPVTRNILPPLSRPLPLPLEIPLPFCPRLRRSCTFALLLFYTPANYPVSGSPLSALSLWSTEPLSLRASRAPHVPVSPCPRAPCAGSAGAYFPSGSAPSAFTPLGIWPMSSSAVRVALKVTVPPPPRSVVITMSPIAR